MYTALYRVGRGVSHFMCTYALASLFMFLAAFLSYSVYLQKFKYLYLKKIGLSEIFTRFFFQIRMFIKEGGIQIFL